MKTVVSSGGVSGLHAGRKFGFEATVTDAPQALTDPEVNTVVIATRHESHARLVCEALRQGKHVFVEKPLALRLEDLTEMEALCAQGKSLLMVGFNRRFAPQVLKIKELLRGVSTQKAFVMTVNAGSIPSSHWTQDADLGGGRIVGEACHFIDLLRHLAGARITKWQRTNLKSDTNDTATLQLTFEDGSIGSVHYFANGSKSFPKERLEVFSDGRVLQLDNFRKLVAFGWPGFKRMNLWRQNKGQRACAAAFVEAIAQGRLSPIPIDEIFEVSRVAIEIARACVADSNTA